MRMLWLMLLFVTACTRSADRAEPLPASPASVSLAQFQELRYLQGSWHGAEAGGSPFFETYVYLNDSTIRSYSYPDSTMALASDSGLIRWSEGEVRSGSPVPDWVATRWDSSSVRFESLKRAGNAYTWTRESPDAWTALLEWTKPDGKHAEMVYAMSRRSS